MLLHCPAAASGLSSPGLGSAQPSISRIQSRVDACSKRTLERRVPARHVLLFIGMRRVLCSHHSRMPCRAGREVRSALPWPSGPASSSATCDWSTASVTNDHQPKHLLALHFPLLWYIGTVSSLLDSISLQVLTAAVALARLELVAIRRDGIEWIGNHCRHAAVVADEMRLSGRIYMSHVTCH